MGRPKTWPRQRFQPGALLIMAGLSIVAGMIGYTNVRRTIRPEKYKPAPRASSGGLVMLALPRVEPSRPAPAKPAPPRVVVAPSPPARCMACAGESTLALDFPADQGAGVCACWICGGSGEPSTPLRIPTDHLAADGSPEEIRRVQQALRDRPVRLVGRIKRASGDILILAGRGFEFDVHCEVFGQSTRMRALEPGDPVELLGTIDPSARTFWFRGCRVLTN